MPTITTQCRVISRPTQHRLITQRHEPHTLLTSSTSIDQERDHRIDLALYGPLIDGKSLDVQFAVGHVGRWTGMILTVEDSGTGGGAAFRLDVEKNGTSIFSDDADKPTVPAGSVTTQTDQTVQADIFVQTFAATDVFHVVIDQVAASAEHATLTLFYQETDGILPTTHHRVDFSYYGGLVVGHNMGPACAIGHAGILTGVLFSIEDKDYLIGYMRAVSMVRAKAVVKESLLAIDAYHQEFKKDVSERSIKTEHLIELSRISDESKIA